MKILITGGTGLIGQAFIRQFDDHQFTVLTRSISGSDAMWPASVSFIESLDILQNLDEFDAVINLAGEPIIDKRWSPEQKHVICQSRWLLTQQLVALFALSQKPPAVFLSGSATGVYGDRGAEQVSEASPVEIGGFSTQLCLNWEKIAMQAEPHTRVVLLRTGIVLSTQGGALTKMLVPFKCFLGGRIGYGEQYMSWIHYQDHINAMHYVLLEKSILGPVNLVAPQAQKNTTFTHTLAQSLNRLAVLPMPKKILQLVLGESSCLLLDSQKVVPQKLLESGFKFKFPTLKSALHDLLISTQD
jgi:uncharacterized protein|tara:strand:- start:4113 stop:5015 length:903 start_codon:yes stop_codon:yes gene_type:complete